MQVELLAASLDAGICDNRTFHDPYRIRISLVLCHIDYGVRKDKDPGSAGKMTSYLGRSGCPKQQSCMIPEVLDALEPCKRPGL